jgi:hypothetical protein
MSSSQTPPSTQLPLVPDLVTAPSSPAGTVLVDLEEELAKVREDQQLLVQQLQGMQQLLQQLVSRDAEQSQSLGQQKSMPAKPQISQVDSEALFQRMLSLGVDDTLPRNSNIQVGVTLKENGVNFRDWEGQLISAIQARNCQPAVNPAKPRTAADGTVKNLIVQSVPAIWASELHSMSLREGFFWVRSKFVGGHCRQINEEWLRMLLKDKMSSTESFDGYVRGKLALYRALVDNCHQITDLALPTAMVNCLPKEMEACKDSLLTNILGKSRRSH